MEYGICVTLDFVFLGMGVGVIYSAVHKYLDRDKYCQLYFFILKYILGELCGNYSHFYNGLFLVPHFRAKNIIYKCACLCVFVSLCVCTCICVYVCVCTCVHAYVCLFVCASVCAYLRVCVYEHVYVCPRACTCGCLRVHVCGGACVYVCVCVCVCVCVGGCMCACVCVFVRVGSSGQARRPPRCGAVT